MITRKPGGQGRLTVAQLRAAVERAEARGLHAKQPDEAKQARVWLKHFRTRLEKAETTGGRA